jgi:hypothetical protein
VLSFVPLVLAGAALAAVVVEPSVVAIRLSRLLVGFVPPSVVEFDPFVAAAIGVVPEDVAEREMGKAEPTISRLRALTEHFGVRDNEIDRRPGHAPSITERLADALEGGT